MAIATFNTVNDGLKPGAQSEIESILSMQCARCGVPTNNVISGRELEVVALELES